MATGTAATVAEGDGRGDPRGSAQRRFDAHVLLALIRSDASWFVRRAIALEDAGVVWRGLDRPGRVRPACTPAVAEAEGACLLAVPFTARSLLDLADPFPDVLGGWFNEEGALRSPRIDAAAARCAELAELMRAFAPVQTERRAARLLAALRGHGFDPARLDLGSTRRGPRAAARTALVGTPAFPNGAHFRATWDALVRAGVLRGIGPAQAASTAADAGTATTPDRA